MVETSVGEMVSLTSMARPVQPVQIDKIVSILKKEMPRWKVPIVGVVAEETKDPFSVLISCILSLRTKDQTTAKATERLFALATTPAGLLKLTVKEIERVIYPVGFYRTKARNIHGICRDLIDRFNSVVPDDIEEPKQTGERRFVIKKEAQLPFIFAGFHVPNHESSDAYALSLLGNILSAGKSSRLYRSLVYEQKIALDAGGSYQGLSADPSLFYFYGVPLPG